MKMKNEKMKMNTRRSPLISIVVTSYTTERLRDIYQLFDSIKKQAYENVEVIFIAERSKELCEMVKAYGQRIGLRRLRAFSNEVEPGLSAGRNLGIMKANGEIIAFVDDDTILFPEWAEEVAGTFKDDTIIGVTGPGVLVWEDKSVEEWFPDELKWMVGNMSWENRAEVWDIRAVGGMNHAFRREAFEKAGLYVTRIGCVQGKNVPWGLPSREETEISLRVKRATGKRVVYNWRMKLYHKVDSGKTTFHFLANRAYRVGYATHLLKRAYPDVEKGAFLTPEKQLLRRILTRLLPSIVLGFFRHPSVAWKKLSVVFTAVFFTGLGYLVYFLKPFQLEGGQVGVKGVTVIKEERRNNADS